MKNNTYNTAFLSALAFNEANFKELSGKIPLEWLKHDKLSYKIYAEFLKFHAQKLPLDSIEFKETRLNEAFLEVLATTPVVINDSIVKEMRETYKAKEAESLSNLLKLEKISLDEFKQKLDELFLKTRDSINAIPRKEKLDDSKLSPFLNALLKNLKTINNYPDTMILSAILSTLSGVIGARAKVNNTFGIEVYPVIWSIIIAPSSLSAKSTLFKYTKRLILGDLQNELYNKFECDSAQYKADLKAFRDSKDETAKEPEAPKIKRIVFATDSTPEAKILSLSQNQNGGIIFYDEFKAELEKSNDNPSYKALKTSMFDGEIYDKELVNRGSIILKHPCVSEIGLITKQWLLEAIQKNDIASGFLARYLISFNERADFKPLEAKELGFCDILEFSDTTKAILQNLGFNREAPLVFKLNKDSKSFYKEWFNEYSKNAYDTETDEELTTSYRLSTYALKIALISQIFNETYKGINICDSKPEIKLEYLQEAIYIISLFRNESDKLLEILKENNKIHFNIDSAEEKLIKKIQASKNGEITRSQALNVRGINAKILDELLQNGILKHRKSDSTTIIYL